MKKSLMTCLVLAFAVTLIGCAGMSTQTPRYAITAPGILQDTDSGQMWQLERSKRFKTYKEAQAFVEQLTLGGYDDWRLPTIYELYDLNYLFDLHQNGTITLDREGNYWSGEKDGDGIIGAWAISDQCGPSREYYTGKAGYVRAVRQ
ncbi:MAG: DUF1566 domain-containing protein [Desulfobulbaceae bacterium]|jgi:hypothetical protein|nr:DUF1566 domain-containing protein [Desulfobulbaceae bacterium]